MKVTRVAGFVFLPVSFRKQFIELKLNVVDLVRRASLALSSLRAVRYTTASSVELQFFPSPICSLTVL